SAPPRGAPPRRAARQSPGSVWRIETDPQLVFAKEIRKVVIAFEAWLLPYFVSFLEPHQRHCHRPGLPVRLRICQRGLVQDRVGIDEREAFGHTQRVAVEMT